MNPLFSKTGRCGTMVTDTSWRIAELQAERDELMEALERIAGFSMSQFINQRDMAMECVTVARKAIAKAKGET